MLGDNIKKLGFGMMRLPRIGDDFDIEQVKVMVDMFMEAGFNYFDTAWAYTGSEEATRKALVERYPRESFLLATKNSAWLNCETREDATKQLEVSLRQAGVDYFDFYLLHNLGDGRTEFFDKFDLWNWAQEIKAEGKVKHIGFSFHSTADVLDDILTRHPEMEFVQLQINYADWEDCDVQSRACYEVARKHNKPVIIMEPVKGGMLANPPEQVKEILKGAEPQSSPASWAVRFCAGLEGVITVLSGMSNIEQMADNLASMKDFAGLDESQLDTIKRAREELAKIPLIPCTKCNYCAKVCPVGVGISGLFNGYNLVKLYGDYPFVREQKTWAVDNKGLKNASACIKCGMCETACPQHIEIRNELEKVEKVFE